MGAQEYHLFAEVFAADRHERLRFRVADAGASKPAPAPAPKATAAQIAAAAKDGTISDTDQARLHLTNTQQAALNRDIKDGGALTSAEVKVDIKPPAPAAPAAAKPAAASPATAQAEAAAVAVAAKDGTISNPDQARLGITDAQQAALNRDITSGGALTTTEIRKELHIPAPAGIIVRARPAHEPDPAPDPGASGGDSGAADASAPAVDESSVSPESEPDPGTAADGTAQQSEASDTRAVPYDPSSALDGGGTIDWGTNVHSSDGASVATPGNLDTWFGNSSWLVLDSHPKAADTGFSTGMSWYTEGSWGSGGAVDGWEYTVPYEDYSGADDHGTMLGGETWDFSSNLTAVTGDVQALLEQFTNQHPDAAPKSSK